MAFGLRSPDRQSNCYERPPAPSRQLECGDEARLDPGGVENPASSDLPALLSAGRREFPRPPFLKAFEDRDEDGFPRADVAAEEVSQASRWRLR